MTMTTDFLPFPDWMTSTASAIESTIDALLPDAPSPLNAAMRYAVLGGGKRLRTMLCVASGVLTDGDLCDALTVGAAIEMIHAYSLAHDDLPCMDDDALRRGKPSCHKQYGEAIALLAGDALLTQAFSVLSRRPLHVDASVRLRMIDELSEAAGAEGMVGGQCLDLTATGGTLTRLELENMHMAKTGALIRASILLGAWTGARRTDNLERDLRAFARELGVLYQVVDDILDVSGTAATLGKTPGKDQAQDKSTYVKLLGLDGAKQEVSRLANAAITRLQPYGPAAERLCELTRYIAMRTS